MVMNPITGATQTPRGPDSALIKGRRFSILDMGRLELSATGADLKVNAIGSYGRIVSILAITDTVTADSDADGTITAEINGSAVTGGVVTVADTGSATPVDTLNQIFQGTAITASNTFNPEDTINIAWATTNAFSDGAVRVLLVLEFGIA